MRIVHISDFHLPAKPGKRVNGVNPHTNMTEAVAVLKKQQPRPDLIVLGGDLFDEGEKGDYQLIVDAFADVQIPLHTVVGNHDHIGSLRKSALVRQAQEQAQEYAGYYSFDHDTVHFVILHSAGTGKSHGILDEEQLFWLSEDLYENRKRPVLIFLHHPPFDSGVTWLDKMKLLNAERFWDIVPPYAENLLGVFVSHLHIQMTCQVRGLLVASSPAVCWQYSGNADAPKAQISEEQPGFNLIDVADSRLRVRAVRFFAPAEEAPAAKSSAASPAGKS